MGFLNLFSKAAPVLMRLPSGSFTLDRTGAVVSSTLPQSFSSGMLTKIGEEVLGTFRAAEEAGLPLGEFTVNYSSFKLTARELRGGAIVFLSPRRLDLK